MLLCDVEFVQLEVVQGVEGDLCGELVHIVRGLNIVHELHDLLAGHRHAQADTFKHIRINKIIYLRRL